MQYKSKVLDKNKRSIQNESSGPEESLRQLSLYDDVEGISSNYNVSIRNIKKASIIQGWIKEKEARHSPPSIKTAPLQTYRKILKPQPSITARTYFHHISFSPKPVNLNEPEFGGQVTHHLTQRTKRRPMSSNLHYRPDPTVHTTFEAAPIKKANYSFLRKNSGIKNSKKTLDKDKKVTVESFTYPMFETQINPQRVIPNIGRISYLVKHRNNREVLSKF